MSASIQRSIVMRHGLRLAAVGVVTSWMLLTASASAQPFNSGSTAGGIVGSNLNGSSGGGYGTMGGAGAPNGGPTQGGAIYGAPTLLPLVGGSGGGGGGIITLRVSTGGGGGGGGGALLIASSG